MRFTIPTVLALAAQAVANAVPGYSSLHKRSKYPFNQLVAFGDELSDNGSGSFAHGITGNPASVYGNDTWTNGPVAVTYLAQGLGVPLNDFAFGGCCGGGSFGATLNTAYTKSPAGAQSLVQQIANYTGRQTNVKHAMQFIWIGENDLSEHTDAFWEGDPQNTWFANNVSSRIASSVQNLLDKGAPYVFVANIYPKHLAPVTPKYLCSDSTCAATWGKVIQQANTAIEASLKTFGNKVIYYDVFSFMVNLLSDPTKHGFTYPLDQICDGQGSANWNICMVEGHANEHFWMNFIQPTTHAHRLIGADMKAAVDKHFGL